MVLLKAKGQVTQQRLGGSLSRESIKIFWKHCLKKTGRKEGEGGKAFSLSSSMS